MLLSASSTYPHVIGRAGRPSKLNIASSRTEGNRLKREACIFKYCWLQTVTGPNTQTGRAQRSVGAQGATA
ncbi:hypothetical protein PFLUV_G00181850 [Perca fluviatilis]|uniref:Uncharacterized protein n=1 Tax=Perca fluviatilis TaxID=8168 RepID=A0A6A5EWB3_PERFL|nr:hypothetical protein PFLUV_G00181850 [Perca fluviatilis]